MVEFALVLPLLLLIVVGLLGFGRLLYYWISANHMANEVARWAEVNTNPATGGVTLQQYIVNKGAGAAGTGEQKANLAVCIDFPANAGNTPPTTKQVGDPVRVRVQQRFAFVPLIGWFAPSLKNGITVTGSSTMRIEQLPTNYAAGTFAGSNTAWAGTCDGT